MNKQDYENAALELQHSMRSKFTGDVKTNFILIEYLGRFGRDYVQDKFPHAIPMYVTNRAGKRTNVGIYNNGGIELTEKQNFPREQRRPQLLGLLVEYHHGSEYVAWRETARAIIKANPNESPELLSSLAAFMAMESIAKGAGPQALEWTASKSNFMQ